MSMNAHRRFLSGEITSRFSRRRIKVCFPSIKIRFRDIDADISVSRDFIAERDLLSLKRLANHQQPWPRSRHPNRRLAIATRKNGASGSLYYRLFFERRISAGRNELPEALVLSSISNFTKCDYVEMPQRYWARGSSNF